MSTTNEKRWIFDASCGEVRPEGVPSTSEQVKAADYVQGSCVLVAESVYDREDGHLIAAAPDLYLALLAAAAAVDHLTRGGSLTAEAAYKLGSGIGHALAKARGEPWRR